MSLSVCTWTDFGGACRPFCGKPPESSNCGAKVHISLHFLRCFRPLEAGNTAFVCCLLPVDGFGLIREQFLPDKTGGAVVIPADQPEYVRLPQEAVCRDQQPIHILPMQTEGGLTQQQR